MKLCASALLALLLLLALPALCLAGETFEGDEYTITLPDGFTQALSMTGSGTMRIKSSMGMLPIDGIPETTVYTHGSADHPQGMVLICRANLKSGSEVKSLDALGMNKIDQLRARLPEGVDVRARKVGKYDAIEFVMEMEALGETVTARMATIACGDFVLTVMIQVQEGVLPSTAESWEQMLSSIKIEKNMSKVVLFGGVGLGALLLVFLWAKFSKTGPPSYVRSEVAPSRFGPTPADARPNPLLSQRPPPGMPTPDRIGAPASPSRPTTIAPAARPGLRSTLAPSGRWEQQRS